MRRDMCCTPPPPRPPFPSPRPLTFLLDTWGKGGRLIRVTKRKASAAKGATMNLSTHHRRTEMKRLVRLRAVSANPRISHTWTRFRKMWERGREKKNSNSYTSLAFFPRAHPVLCCDAPTASSPPWPNGEWDVSPENLLSCLSGDFVFLVLDIVGVVLWRVFFSSLPPHRLLPVIFVFIEVLFAAAAAAATVYSASTHQRCWASTQPHPRPLRGAQPHLPGRPLLHLPEWRTFPGKGTTQQRRDSAREGCGWSEAG